MLLAIKANFLCRTNFFCSTVDKPVGILYFYTITVMSDFVLTSVMFSGRNHSRRIIGSQRNPGHSPIRFAHSTGTLRVRKQRRPHHRHTNERGSSLHKRPRGISAIAFPLLLVIVPGSPDYRTDRSENGLQSDPGQEPCFPLYPSGCHQGEAGEGKPG